MLDYYARKYALTCPKCNEELYLYTYSSTEMDILKCIQCKEYYQKSSSQALKLTNPPLLPFLNYDEAYVNYEGFPSSYAYSPNWLTRLRRLSQSCFRSSRRN